VGRGEVDAAFEKCGVKTLVLRDVRFEMIGFLEYEGSGIEDAPLVPAIG